jgi:hypothetical protein
LVESIFSSESKKDHQALWHVLHGCCIQKYPGGLLWVVQKSQVLIFQQEYFNNIFKSGDFTATDPREQDDAGAGTGACVRAEVPHADSVG